MKSLNTLMTLAALFTLGACSTEPVGSSSPTAGATGTSQEDLMIQDCQKQLVSCTKAAHSLTEFGKCTADLTSCTTQSALDVVGQGNLLTNCRTKANTCLKGAVSVSDISSCREIFGACTSDLGDAADGVLGTAIKTATDAIGKAGDLATSTINTATGDVGKALDAVGACETSANSCLKGVVKAGDVTSCEKVFDTCTSNAISLVDTIVAPLPIPTPSQVIGSLSSCQDQSTACLKGALTITDVSACRNVLQTCVKDAASVVDSTITGVTSILPLPLPKLPGVGQTVDCTSGLAECLLKLGNPVDCATQATACETK
ncbi:MAG TPA: hypothetical protein VH062_17205 [Polyangiaceae bacterium]|jgi:hypothetical protein|nr:hypothetical protein [Polyangiaceae bacterium]